ncbi:MAG: circadian clock KaiB family protein [Bacteroidota bacterium]
MSSKEQEYKLKLFIAGVNPASIKAIENVKYLCEEYLKDVYDLEVIDIYQQKHLLKDKNIIAVPTLIRENPGPEKRIIGDMSETKNLIKALEINIRKDHT